MARNIRLRNVMKETEESPSESPDRDDSPFETPAIEGMPYEKGSDEDAAIERVLEKTPSN
jgi:hypothetical protein